MNEVCNSYTRYKEDNLFVVNIGEIHYDKENKTDGGKQIEFSAERSFEAWTPELTTSHNILGDSISIKNQSCCDENLDHGHGTFSFGLKWSFVFSLAVFVLFLIKH